MKGLSTVFKRKQKNTKDCRQNSSLDPDTKVRITLHKYGYKSAFVFINDSPIFTRPMVV